LTPYPDVSLDLVFIVRPVREALEVIPNPLVLCVEDMSAIFTLLEKKPALSSLTDKKKEK